MVNKLPTVSIIVPVYNGEQVIRRCVDSVLKQSFTDWELLLINDGSTDSSFQICQEYADTYQNIFAFHKENEGVSVTRNIGIQEAKGIYVKFVDCDDYLEQDHIKLLVERMEDSEADLVISGYTRHKEGNITKNYPKESFSESKEEFGQLFFLLYNRWFLNTPWNKLYRREKIRAGFPKELSLGEDLLFNLEYIKGIDRICVCEETGYQYCIENTNSLAIQYREDKFENSLFLHNKVLEFVREELNIKEEMQWNDEAFIKEIRFTITNMMRGASWIKKEKKKKIHEWITRQEVQDGYRRCNCTDKKDKLLKILVQRRWSGVIYYIMKYAG